MTNPDSEEPVKQHAASSKRHGRPSLLGGRSKQSLENREIRTVGETFAGFDAEVPVRFEDTESTSFRLEEDEFGAMTGMIVYGRDIYPGKSIVDPNSALSMPAAAAHEISHYYRWRDRTEYPEVEFEYLDEALTSLDAALRFQKLTPHEVKQLIMDAVQRIQLFYGNAVEGN